MKCLTQSKIVLILTLTTTMLTGFVGCATFKGAESRQNLAKLKYGMSEASVLSLLGMPDSVSRNTNKEDQWIYEFKNEQRRGQNFYIVFKDGAVEQTGQFDGREIAAEKEFGRPGTCTRRVNFEVMQEAICVNR